jgi:hypothetical protein
MMKWAVIGGLLALLLLGGYLARERKTWTEFVPAVGGGSEIEYRYSQWRYIEILPHGNGIGGGGERYELRIKNRGKTYQWEGRARPVVLRNRGSELYMVGIEEEGRDVFRLYRGEGGGEMKELGREAFPKELGIQNLWRYANDEAVVKAMDFSDTDFRSSVTGQLWQFLETGVEPGEKWPEEEFLRGYWARNLKQE